MNMHDIRADVLLSLQVALLGMITINVRGITCSWNSKLIKIKFIYDKNFSEYDRELCEEIASEVASHFPNLQVITELIILNFPISIKKEILSDWVYIRRESNMDL